MPDMNTALHAQEHDGRSRWYRQQSMADEKRSKLRQHFSKCYVDYARSNICDVKCKASGGNPSDRRKHLVNHKSFFMAEETIFNSLRSTATTPAFGAVSTPASVSVSSSAASNMAGF
ncbi:hypothetical protein ATANTOWER_003975 [Ataeniobius toweri]|uniref:Uncharacterized protein n=1 Tax=Ataeniobius toweri TaxID=208326 RepID=A0ABU7AEX5_9TELE|nr:hypothetical protein [Ataeniobius toweri]